MGSSGDLAGILSAVVSTQSTFAPQNSQKRRKLRHYDLLPAQLLNSMGASGIETVDLGRLWTSMRAGNKVAEAFSELCFPESERQGVALSRFAEVMIATIDRFINTPHYKVVIREDLYALAKAEADRLMPAFRALYAGRGGLGEGGGSLRSLAYHRPQAPAGDIADHVSAVYQWLSQETSTLRSVIAVLSGGRLFFVAQCHGKGVRAWLKHGGGSESVMTEACGARRPIVAGDTRDLAAIPPAPPSAEVPIADPDGDE